MLYLCGFLDLLSSIPGVFTVLANISVPLLQLLLFVPSMAYLGVNYPKLLQQRCLPAPKQVGMFLINVLLYCVVYVIVQEEIQGSIGNNSNATIVMAYSLTLFYTEVIISFFITGICLNQFCQKAANSSQINKNELMEHVSSLTKDIKLLKKVLSPFLFTAFSLKCVLIINSALILFSSPAGYPATTMASILISSVWDLFYITVIVDETMDSYKSLAIHLRYLLLILVMNKFM
jgi:hypothetical protein